MIKTIFDEDETQADSKQTEKARQPENAHAPADVIVSPEQRETVSTTLNDANSSSETSFSYVEDKTSERLKNELPSFQAPAKPESLAETARKSGMAYAAAITLFGSIVFSMIIGWFADLLLGISPWGIVAGIVLGSGIGFYQFFKITSQILKNKD